MTAPRSGTYLPQAALLKNSPNTPNTKLSTLGVSPFPLPHSAGKQDCSSFQTVLERHPLVPSLQPQIIPAERQSTG